MGVALTIIGVTVLLILVAISLKKQHEGKAAERLEDAGRHSEDAVAQREESTRRRMGVRAAHAERVRVGAAESGEAGPDADSS